MKGMALPNRCYLCMEDKEFVDHLLLHCTKTRIFPALLFFLFGTMWVISGIVNDTLLSWSNSLVE